MNFRYIFALIIIACVFLFPQKVRAVEGYTFVEIKQPLPQQVSLKDFEAFFADESLNCVPRNVKVLSAKIEDKQLILNVSKEILNYGGAYYEEELVRQLLETALKSPNVSTFTLLIDGIDATLPEGNVIYYKEK